MRRDGLTRPRKGKVIAGVCAGIARHFGIDVAIVRIAAVVLALTSGVGVLAYGIAWVALPVEDPPVDGSAVRPVPTRTAGAAVVGMLLILAGATILLQRLLPAVGAYLWPVVLVALGVMIIMRGGQR